MFLWFSEQLCVRVSSKPEMKIGHCHSHDHSSLLPNGKMQSCAAAVLLNDDYEVPQADSKSETIHVDLHFNMQKHYRRNKHFHNVCMEDDFLINSHISTLLSLEVVHYLKCCFR